MIKYGIWDYFFYAIISIAVSAIIFLITLIPCAMEKEQLFISDCISKGGVPSKYSTMVGKSSQYERLCIKKDTIIEMGSNNE